MLDKQRVVGFEIPEAGSSGDKGGDPDRDIEKEPAVFVGGIECEEEKAKNGGEHLGDGFVFADFFGGEDDAFLAGHETDPRDEELACHDEGNKPNGKKAGPEQADEGHHDEELVSEGIKEAAEIGLDPPFAGQMAVQPVGQSGGDKENESEPSGPERDRGVSASLEKDEQDKGGGDTGEGKPVGNSHVIRLR